MYTKSFEGKKFFASGSRIFAKAATSRSSQNKHLTLAFIIDGTINNPPLTGIAYRFVHLSKALALAGHKVHWIVGNRNHTDKAALKQFLPLPVSMHFVPIADFYRPEKIAKLLEGAAVDVAIFDIPHDALFHIPKLREVMPGLAIVLQCHDIEAALSPYKHKPEKIALQEFIQSYVCDLADSVIAMTPADRGTLVGELGVKQDKLFLAPNGVWAEEYEVTKKRDTNAQQSIVFVGNMFYQPNAEAFEYYADRVLPEVIREFPNCILKGVGMLPARLHKKYKNKNNIQLLGAVESFAQYKSIVGNSDVAVCPVLSGSGMKVKILEFSALSLPVITTKVGLSGYEENINLIIANSPASMAKITKDLLASPIKAKKIGAANRAFVKRHLHWRTIAQKVEQAIRHAVKQRRRGPFVQVPYEATWLSEGRILKTQNQKVFLVAKGKIVEEKFK
jgi:glycosyltransferase involved in cell wall biosynthesis